ncbi:hypothetical protein ACROSR_17000 [Roseovarius tibetensis]|uniref:hypothetical protein n=1 Tax=Roseovarius tibetensis TaxID=2685897 RepID=UPI003D7F838A
MKAVGYVACIIGGAILCYLLLSLGVVDAVDGLPGTMQEPAIAMPTYLGFMSAMMTAVTAVLAAVAIGIGVIAAFTVQELRQSAKDAVADARDIAEEARAQATAAREEALAEVRSEPDRVYRRAKSSEVKP